ncbi:MAG: hypothetical protein OK439_00015 [Thaumarchaeota archaeon]|nr:hypothetical protein [Nitrososphaerota archaeon]
MRKFAYLMLAIIISSAFLGTYLVYGEASSAIQTTTIQTTSVNEDFFNQTSPPGLITNAPYPGYDYYLFYNLSNGVINAIITDRQASVIQSLSHCGISASGFDNMTLASGCLFADTSARGEGVINATSYSNLSTIIQHSNAFLVNVSSSVPVIDMKSGWSNCSNPYYGNGTTPCN